MTKELNTAVRWPGFLSAGSDVSYLLLRVAFGIILVTHGIPKLLHEAHGSEADPMSRTIEIIRTSLHLPLPIAWAWLVTVLETAGGLMLACGVLVRPLAAMVAGEMAGIAIGTGPAWVWYDRGIEYAVLMGFLAAYMAFNGKGTMTRFNAWRRG